MIYMKNITKSYERDLILDKLSFTLNKAEFVYLVGKSGAGKSTFLSILAGDMQADEGEVISETSQVFLLKQSSSLDENLTIYENALYYFLSRGETKKRVKNKLDKIFQELDIFHLKERFPHQLSGGELARASLAQALAYSPEVLLLDEVTAGLAPFQSENIVRLLESEREKGMAILFSTHDQELIQKHPQKVLELKGGKLYEI
ncbi:MAG: ATP-binding cassette domain-containing protein [Streptococcaceae bacterium]|jgi:cell division transport system ATP-binding protein|nr:ATP-binding cassette domain-containing protein [Streptococcaceae bacterium]